MFYFTGVRPPPCTWKQWPIKSLEPKNKTLDKAGSQLTNGNGQGKGRPNVHSIKLTSEFM